MRGAGKRSTHGNGSCHGRSCWIPLAGGLPATLELKQPCSEDELQTALNATHVLLNRVPTGNERLISAESRLRNQDIDLTEFIAEVAMSEAFQNRIATMAPFGPRPLQVWLYSVEPQPQRKPAAS